MTDKSIEDMDVAECYRAMKSELAETITTSMMSVIIVLLAKIDGEDVPQSLIGKIRKCFDDPEAFAKLVTHTFLTPLQLEEVQLVDAMFKKDITAMLKKCTELQLLYAEADGKLN